MCLFKCITGLASENPLAVNVLTNLKVHFVETFTNKYQQFYYVQKDWWFSDRVHYFVYSNICKQLYLIVSISYNASSSSSCKNGTEDNMFRNF